jgi:hypothetical protein
LLLDAAGPEQRKALSSIYLIVCPGVGAGSGFVIEPGLMVTNAHVVSSCTADTLLGVSNSNRPVHFSKVITDSARDLSILIPRDGVTHGLKLASKDNPLPGTVVSTWGYPLLYNGTTPLLSVGYVSGYRDDTSGGRSVKHIVVNGAFNHGNSGGPLLIAQQNEVIGIVVLTFHFYPPEVKQIIDALSKIDFGVMLGQARNPDGSIKQVSESQVTAMVLEEFYQKTQVMIGEAIAVSELAAMIKEHASDLPSKR